MKKPGGTAEEIEQHFGCESSRLIMVVFFVMWFFKFHFVMLSVSFLYVGLLLLVVCSIVYSCANNRWVIGPSRI